MKEHHIKQKLILLEKQYAESFVDFRKGDTLYTYLMRKGMKTLAAATKADYIKAKLPYTSTHMRA